MHLINNQTKVAGLSLVELMTVITIVAILAAIAFPVYKDYTLKARISDTSEVIDEYMLFLKNEYVKNGNFPSSVVVNGVTLNSGSWARLDASSDIGIIKAGYYIVAPDGLGAGFSFVLKDLTGIPNYIEPAVTATNPTTGGYQTFAWAIRDDNDSLKVVCGQADSGYSTNAIPFDYLPKNCDCADTIGFYGFNKTGSCIR